MTEKFPPAPPIGTAMSAARPSPEARAMLALRRSAGSKTLTEPGPSPSEVTEILKVAARVPDHRKLEPWRFIVYEGEARAAFGKTIASHYKAANPDAKDTSLAEEEARFLRAPVVIAVISAPDKAHKTPVWEQELSAGALCHNLLLSANAAGWAGVWLTEWIAFDAQIAIAMGLSADERVAGFIYLGTASILNTERPRPDILAKITRP